MKKTLYQACKDFVNEVGAGNEFKTEEFTNEVGEYCTPTSWNLSNNNPYYRAHTYKTFFKKSGIISQVKRGLWKVNAPIPSEVTLTDFQYDTGYTNTSVYNKNTKTTKFYKIKNNPFDFKQYLEDYDLAKEYLKDFEAPYLQHIGKNNGSNSLGLGQENSLVSNIKGLQFEIEDDFDDIAANSMLTEVFDDIIRDLKPGDFIYNSSICSDEVGITDIRIQKEKVVSLSVKKTLTDIKIDLKTDKNSYDEINVLDVYLSLAEALEFLSIRVDQFEKN
tara:strand:+ start:2979 stop:3806 length:828 start_codon:yes stop_codon:yes gene_type:complete